MDKQVTFGVDVANALLREGVCRVGPLHTIKIEGSARRLHPYHLLEGTTLTSEQVTAAVQADPERLAAQPALAVWPSNCAYVRSRGDGWDLVASGSTAPLKPTTAGPDKKPDKMWNLVYRPDLGPEQPPRPAQGTTLRVIIQEAVHRFGGHTDGMFTSACFGEAFCRLTRLSETLDGRIAEAFLSGRSDVERLSPDGCWRLRPAVESREGPELWAWMCRTGRRVVSQVRGVWFVDRHGVLWAVPDPGDLPQKCHYFPMTPCTPVDGGTWDEAVCGKI